MVPRAPGSENHPPILSVQTLMPVSSGPLRNLAASATLPQPNPVHVPRFVVQSAAQPTSTARAQIAPLATLNNASNIPAGGLAASAGLSFDGVGLGLVGVGNPPFQIAATPPDPSGAAGLTQYVQWVNFSYAVFRKSDGALLLGPVPGSNIWTNLGGPCKDHNSGDPIVLYDKLANRWLLAQFAIVDPIAGPFFECIAVSKTSDATGDFNLYQQEFVNDPNNPPSANNTPIFNDFPKFGVMPDAYYASYNTFTSDDPQTAQGTGERACAYDRNAMLNGDPIRAACEQLPFFNPDPDNTLLPPDLDGNTLPPAGAPVYYLGMDFSTSSIALYRFHVDFTTPTNSTFDNFQTRILIPPTQPGVDNFSEVCFGAGVHCITQPNTTNTLDAKSDRSGYRFAYRNFGDHEAWVLTHVVEGAFQDTNEPTDVGWWELRRTGTGNPAIFQSHAQFDRQPGPGANINRWLSSVALDKTSDMLQGYSISAGNDLNDSTIQIFPSIGLQGRSRTDPAGTTTALSTGEVVMAGGGSITDANDFRWGDYSQMTVDPVDDCTFWYTNEYISANTIFVPKWSTRILSFKFPACSSTPDFSILPIPLSGSVIVGTTTTYSVSVSSMAGFTAPVSLSTSGLPSGVTGTFNPTTIAGAGTSTLTINAPGTNTPGDFSFNITGTSGTTNLIGAPGNISHSSTVTLAVNNFSISAVPALQKVAPGNSTTYTVSVAWNKDFGDSVTLSVTGQPALANVSFNPPTITQNTTSTLTITVDPSTALGDYPLTITGTHASGIQRTAIVHLDVTDFTPTASPTAQTTTAGSTTSYTVSVADVRGFGFSDPVTLSLDPATLPAGVQGTFTPNPVQGVGTSTLALTTSATTPAGTSNITIKGTDGTDVHTTSVSLTVNSGGPGACLSPAALSFPAQTVGIQSTGQAVTLTSCGSAALSIASISATGDFAQTNNCGTSLAVGVACTITVTFSPTVAGTRTGLLSVSDNAAGSPHSVALSGTGSAPPPDFSLTVSPARQQVVATGSTSYAVTITAANGFTGTVIPSVSGLPTFVSGTFSPSSIVGSGTSTLTITVPGNATPADSTLTITGTSGSISHSASVVLSIVDVGEGVVSPQSQSVIAGAAVSYSFTAIAENGYNGLVVPSAENLPPNTSVTFNPPTLTGGGTFVATLTTQTTTPVGTYSPGFVITAGPRVDAQGFTLVVQPVPDFTLSLSPLSQSVTQGGSVTYSAVANATSTCAFTGGLPVSVSGLPTGATATVTAGTAFGTSNVAIATTTSTPGGTYTLTMTASGCGVTHSGNVSLTVNVPQPPPPPPTKCKPPMPCE